MMAVNGMILEKNQTSLDEVEYKIKSSYINGVLDGRLYGYLKTGLKIQLLLMKFLESRLII